MRFSSFSAFDGRCVRLPQQRQHNDDDFDFTSFYFSLLLIVILSDMLPFFKSIFKSSGFERYSLLPVAVLFQQFTLSKPLISLVSFGLSWSDRLMKIAFLSTIIAVIHEWLFPTHWDIGVAERLFTIILFCFGHSSISLSKCFSCWFRQQVHV